MIIKKNKRMKVANVMIEWLLQRLWCFLTFVFFMLLLQFTLSY